jgi:hypothetical protein
VLAGCLGPGYEVAEVKGTVTVDGVSAEGVMLEFTPAPHGDRQPPLAYGFTDATGAYSARNRKGVPGAVVGVNRVSISAVEGSRTTVPAGYSGTDAVEREVKTGPNTIDFQLTNTPDPE